MPRVLPWLLLPLFLAAAPATRPDSEDHPVTLAEAKATEQARSTSDFAGQPVVHAKNVEEVLTLTLENRDLRLNTTLQPIESAIVRIPRMPGLAHVKFLGAAEPGQPMVMVHYDFEIRDYTVPDAISIYTSASYTAGNLTLSQMWERLDDETQTVQLLQAPVQQGVDEPHVMLYVQITAEPKVELKLSADNVIELRRKYPAEVAKYVDPIFRALHQNALLAHVDPKLAWQVFADTFQPPAQLREKVKSLVAQLDADKFQDREAASRELESLGEGAALLLMRQDRTHLSDEQISRIDAFVAKFKLETDEHVARMRVDRDFLIDCLNSDEPAIRAAALAQLHQVTGRAITFDLNADPAHRQTAIDELREDMGAPTTNQHKD